MIFLGDPSIPYESINIIKTTQDIETTQANSTVVFDFSIELLQYTSNNSIRSGVKVNSILEALYAHNLDAKYIITPSELASKLQDLADHYMFDSKIIAIIADQAEIEDLAKKHIDGVIYQHLLG